MCLWPLSLICAHVHCCHERTIYKCNVHVVSDVFKCVVAITMQAQSMASWNGISQVTTSTHLWCLWKKSRWVTGTSKYFSEYCVHIPAKQRQRAIPGGQHQPTCHLCYSTFSSKSSTTPTSGVISRPAFALNTNGTESIRQYHSHSIGRLTTPVLTGASVEQWKAGWHSSSVWSSACRSSLTPKEAKQYIDVEKLMAHLVLLNLWVY